MIDLIKKIWLPLVFAFLVGFIIILPQFLLVVQLGSNYQGINITENDSENYYIARIREAYDGHWRVANAEFYEYKDLPYLQPPLPEIFLAAFAKLFLLKPIQIAIIGKFVFPALLFLVIYFFVLNITKSKIIALATPLAIILAYDLIQPNNIFAILGGNFWAISHLNDYGRAINPQISSVVFFFWLYCFYNWSKSEKEVFFYLSAIILGLMFYIYLYSWILALVIIGLMPFVNGYAFSKIKFLIKKTILMTFISLLISSFFWLNLFTALQNPYYKLASIRYGFYLSHQPIFGALLFLDLILLLLLYLWKKERFFDFNFFVTFFIANLIVINQQVITGVRFYPGHWHWYYTIPLSIILFFWLLNYFSVELNKKLFLNIFLVFIILFSLIFGTLQQSFTYLKLKDVYTDYQKYAAIFQWLENNTSKDDVVLTNEFLRDKMLVYTSNNNYLQSNYDLYLTPGQRFSDNFYISLKLKKISPNDFSAYVVQNPYDIWEVLPGYYNRGVYGCNLCYNPGEITNLKDGYRRFLEKDFYNELRKYRLDYAVWDTNTNQIWDLDKYSFFKFIIEINGVRIYKFI